MERAATEIDVLAVGIDAQPDHVGAQLGQRVGGDLVGRAVGAIDHQLEPVEGHRARHAALEKHQVAADGVVDTRGLADFAGARAQMGERTVVENQVLDPALGFVVELESFAGEELDAVVLERIMRG